MPEIAEAARIVHFLKTHLVGKRIKTARGIDDASVFGKVGTTGDAVANALQGKKVVGTGSQGKYFWLVLDSAPHLVMHFGMTGWLHIRGMRTGYTNYYNKLKPGDADAWPPKYWKFQLETDSSPKVEVAFTDPRRFGRVRLVDCPGAAIRKHSPLVENGPDPVVDADTTFTEDYFLSTLRKRHVPIKALLLDQAFISGIGNWVGDEVLFNARLHPEQYCDEFSDAQMKTLYKSIRYVCSTAVDLLGDSDKFPAGWLFQHRWGKGGKDSVARLPNGEKLAFLTVGGRTSCFAPGLQKKSGNVAPGIKEEPVVIKDEKPKKAAAVKPQAAKNAVATTKKEPVKKAPTAESKGAGQKRKRGAVKEDADDEGKADDEGEKPSLKSTQKNGAAGKKAKTEPAPAKKAAAKPAAKPAAKETPAANIGRRRSTRLSTS
ncbi:formamidopyrimidine-DNA glucosyllase [Sporothrix schenckii 1099-18]|uniref:Formamidopyrimidine-DNA glucosyllase n=1 Tax=Sporothrix schenckii 1099-18 TaxID=1397361 RepID=A0A0F2LTZ3_SPOSC|nr:formamidopyrimidine-DNA glucosyllase [Sporothrix schenckii 1099-18]KJR80932.1 formamidopyrimidine-DNA glucosyllase [Sporothrix schenckii 1099-18]